MAVIGGVFHPLSSGNYHTGAESLQVNNSTVPDVVEKTALLARIDARLEALGKTRYWLSQQISDGRHHGIITDIARKGTMPRGDRIRRMAEALQTTTDYLTGLVDEPGSVRSEVGVSDRLTTWRGPIREEPGIPLVGTGDCADLEVCDESGHLVEIERSSFDPDFTVRIIERPPALRGAPDIYAIYFHGSSMEPRFEPGEIGIVDPRRPVGPGDYVLVQLREDGEHEVTSVLAKRLVRQNSKCVVLEQFNPPLTFTLPRSRVARAHRIMRQTDLLY